MRRSLPVVTAMLVAGCASTPEVGEIQRDGATSVAADDHIATWVLRHETCRSHVEQGDGNCEYTAIADDVQPKFARCIESAVEELGSTLRVAPAAALALPVSEDALRKGPVGSNTLATAMADPSLRDTLAAIDARYLIVLQVTTRDYDRRSTGWADGFSGLWGYGRTSLRNTTIDVDVFDLPTGARAGHFDVSSQGKSGWYLQGWLIPLVPVPYAARTEAAACKSIGESLLQFLAG